MADCKYKIGDLVRIVDHDTLIARGYYISANQSGYDKPHAMPWVNNMDRWIGTTARITNLWHGMFDSSNEYRLSLSAPLEKSGMMSLTDVWNATTNFIELVEAWQAPAIEDLLVKDGTYVQSLQNGVVGCHVDDVVYYLDKSGEWVIEPYTQSWQKWGMPDVIKRFPQLRLGDDYILLNSEGYIIDRFVFNSYPPREYDNVADIRILRHKQVGRMFDDDDYVMSDNSKIVTAREVKKLYLTDIPNRYRYLDSRLIEKHYLIIKGSLASDIDLQDTTTPTDITTLAAEMDDDTTTVYVKNDRVFNSENKFSIIKEYYKYVG